MRLVTFAVALTLRGSWGWKSENDCKNDVVELIKLFGKNSMAKPYVESVRASSGPYCAQGDNPTLCHEVFQKDWMPAIKIWMSNPAAVETFCQKAMLETEEDKLSVCDQCAKDMTQLKSFLDKIETWEAAQALLRTEKLCRQGNDISRIEACVQKVHLITPLALQIMADTVEKYAKEICRGLKKGCREEL